MDLSNFQTLAYGPHTCKIAYTQKNRHYTYKEYKKRNGEKLSSLIDSFSVKIKDSQNKQSCHTQANMVWL